MVPATTAPEKLTLNSPEAAGALGISERTLWALTEPRGPIKSVRFGRSVRYSRKEIERVAEQGLPTRKARE